MRIRALAIATGFTLATALALPAQAETPAPAPEAREQQPARITVGTPQGSITENGDRREIKVGPGNGTQPPQPPRPPSMDPNQAEQDRYNSETNRRENYWNRECCPCWDDGYRPGPRERRNFRDGRGRWDDDDDRDYRHHHDYHDDDDRGHLRDYRDGYGPRDDRGYRDGRGPRDDRDYRDGRDPRPESQD
ncbi:MAG: hypothetical protein K6A65_01830 [Succinivibrionaceae bacterium]|nr:hypothetical protein [Succinivibrionaceae bacterium]